MPLTLNTIPIPDERFRELQAQIDRLYSLGINERYPLRAPRSNLPRKFFSKDGAFDRLHQTLQREVSWFNRLFYTNNRRKLEQLKFLNNIEIALRNLAWLKYSINPSLNQKIIAYRINPNVELENEMFSSPVYQTTNQLDLSEVGYLIAAIAHTADVFEAVQKHVSGQNLSGIEIERVNEALRALPIEANALPKKL